MSTLYECFKDISEPDELLGAIERICDVFELKHVAYLGIGLPRISGGEPFVVSTYHADWANVYREKEFVLIDPVVLRGTRSLLPIDWRELRSDNETVFATASRFGVGNQGMTMPIRGPMGECALFSVSTAEQDKHWDLFLEEYQPELNLVGFHLHELIVRVQGIIKQHSPLAPREREVLMWIANGKTSQDVADILDISHNTVRHYAEQSRMKLQALNAAHACARALALGLIPPPD